MTASLEEARRFLILAGDDFTAYRMLAEAAHIRTAIALFHAQQAVEKSLKAVLFAHGVVRPHSLPWLRAVIHSRLKVGERSNGRVG